MGVDPQTLFLDEGGGEKGVFQSFYVYFVWVDWKYIYEGMVYENTSTRRVESCGF